MDKIELFRINTEGRLDISQIVNNIVSEGEYRSCCRTLGFELLENKIVIKSGEAIELRINDNDVFAGMITNKGLSTDSKIINISCKDGGMFLKRNSFTYKFKDISPKSIVQKICTDFGLTPGNIYDLNTKVTRNFINVNLYDIIMTAYSLNSDKKFHVTFTGKNLNVLERGELVEKHILKDNLISVNASESTDSMINTVNVWNYDNQKIKVVQNDDERKLYGQFNDNIKLTKDDKTDYNLEANKRLKGVEQKISVANIGNYQFTTGKAVIIETPINGIKGKYHIDADTHIYKNGIYTNKLVLNFDCVMDEKESGELEKSDGYKKTSSKSKANVDYSKYIEKLKEAAGN